MQPQPPKFTPYDEGNHALLIGHGDSPSQGQRMKKGLEFYNVEEINIGKCGMWIATLKRDNGDKLCGY